MLHKSIEKMQINSYKLRDLSSIISKRFDNSIKLVGCNITYEEIKDRSEELSSQSAELYKNISSTALKLLLREQPVAKDLRMLSTTPSIARELVRIGNQCQEITQDFKDQQCSKVLKQTHCDELILKVCEMLKVVENLIKSIDIDEENVAVLAKELSKYDSDISKLILKVRDNIEQEAKEDINHLKQYFLLLSFVSHLKIISSESHSIGRSAKFIITGKTRRHI